MLYMRDDLLRGGKYKGKKLDYVIKNHPSYIRWVLANDIFQITERAKYLLGKIEKSQPK